MYPVTPVLQKQIDVLDKMARQSIHETVDVFAEGGITIACEFIKDTFLGQIAPGVASTVMNYRQKRFEKNTLATIEELKLQVQPIIHCFSKMDAEQRTKIGDEVFPLLFDYTADEPEQEKIKLFVNGFCSAAEQQLTEESKILFLYDILKSLRMIEIKFLLGVPEKLMKLYKGIPSERMQEYNRYQKWLEQFPVSPSHKRCIIQKLNRFDLVSVLDAYIPPRIDVAYRLDQLQLSPFGKEFIDFFKAQGSIVTE